MKIVIQVMHKSRNVLLYMYYDGRGWILMHHPLRKSGMHKALHESGALEPYVHFSKGPLKSSLISQDDKI
jgi:hypothetical protein